MAVEQAIKCLREIKNSVPKLIDASRALRLRGPVEGRLNADLQGWRDDILSNNEGAALLKLFNNSGIETEDLAGVAIGKYDAFRKRQRVRLGFSELWHDALGVGYTIGGVTLPLAEIGGREGFFNFVDKLVPVDLTSAEPVVIGLGLVAAVVTGAGMFLQGARERQTSRILHASHSVLVSQKDEAVRELEKTHTTEAQPRRWFDRKFASVKASLEMLRRDRSSGK